MCNDIESLETPEDATFVLVIDTDTYSGNFEREMTAFCTGQFGECGKGLGAADDYGEHLARGTVTIDFAGLVVHRPDEHGIRRPTAIWPTPGRYNDGMGGHFDGHPGKGQHPAYESVAIFLRERPTAAMVETVKARALAFVEWRMRQRFTNLDAPIAIRGFRLLRETSSRVVTEEPFPGVP